MGCRGGWTYGGGQNIYGRRICQKGSLAHNRDVCLVGRVAPVSIIVQDSIPRGRGPSSVWLFHDRPPALLIRNPSEPCITLKRGPKYMFAFGRRERDDAILSDCQGKRSDQTRGARTFLPSTKSRAVRWYGAEYNQGCQRIGQKEALKLALKSPRKNWVVSGAKKEGREMWTWVSSHARRWICLFISVKKSCWGG